MSDLVQAKYTFVDALLTCRSFRNRQARNTVVAELPFGSRVERSSVDFDDAFDIVNTALDHTDGIDQLVQRVQTFEGGSTPAQGLNDLAQHLKYIYSDGRSGKRLEVQKIYILRNKIARDFLITQLISIIEQPLLEKQLLSRIYQECFPNIRRGDYRFLHSNVHRSLLLLFETKYEEHGYGFGICVFASVIGQQFSVWTETSQWIDTAMSKMSWQFPREAVEIEADVVRQQVKKEQLVYLQVEITALSADGTLISADLYHWCREDRSDLSHHKIEKTTFAELPDEIDEQIDGKALIELFLPAELMHMNVEFSDEKEYSLIVEHQVIRRFVDRQKIAKMTKPTRATNIKRRHYKNWIKRWEIVKQSNSLADLFHPIQPLALNSRDSLSNLKIDMKSQSNI